MKIKISLFLLFLSLGCIVFGENQIKFLSRNGILRIREEILKQINSVTEIKEENKNKIRIKKFSKISLNNIREKIDSQINSNGFYIEKNRPGILVFPMKYSISNGVFIPMSQKDFEILWDLIIENEEGFNRDFFKFAQRNNGGFYGFNIGASDKMEWMGAVGDNDFDQMDSEQKGNLIKELESLIKKLEMKNPK